MSTSGANVEDIYETQNDQRLDELHTKLRSLRGVTTDIHRDVEAQNLMLDETGDRFSSFGARLAQTSQRAGQVFGIGSSGGLKPWRIAALIVSVFLVLWILRKLSGWWWGV